MPIQTSFRNNLRLISAVTVLTLLVLLGAEVFLRKSRDFSPDFLASVLLYSLTVLNLTLLFILLFVLGRNIVRILMERRRGVLGARFRMRLLIVFVLMAMTPTVLLVFVGSGLIEHTVERWFNVDVERILSSSQVLNTALHETIASRDRLHARFLAKELESRELLLPERLPALRRLVEARARDLRLDMVSVRSQAGELVMVMDPRLPASARETFAARPFAEQALLGREGELVVQAGTGEMSHVAIPVRGRAGILGVVVVSSALGADLAAEAREVELRYSKFQNARSYKEPIKSLYLSLYLFPALLILFGAVWLALYLARRITTPLRLIATGTERIAAGERRVRVDFPAGNDEFQAVIDSFNRMSERLSRSEEDVAQSREGLAHKNQELIERQRLLETVLNTVGTGVVVVDAEASITAVNETACRLMEKDARGEFMGQALQNVLASSISADVMSLVQRVLSGRTARQERELAFTVRGRERHLALTIVALNAPGALLVLDDLTPLIRAQKVAAWGEVARKLAHEIKNPLTPIQLSAQRIRKAYFRSAPDLERIISECSHAIVEEVDALKNLVDEFAQFARLPAVKLAATALNEVVEQVLSLYDGQYTAIHFERRKADDLPLIPLDASQMKRVLINLLDNAIEAVGKQGRLEIVTERDSALGRARIMVSDDGPGIAPEDRDQLFVPHFSTKRRGGGLGLAIVSRIVEEHHGVVRVEDNQPHGARFIIELPL
ncbi:MAG: ATP-binding protein [Vicinamibacteria bacterium]|jgi:two-component system nitrogen regulation sensor histidine kinase NtrY|nr:ATP-binding protein [Vicinamibacteria bacterium]